MGESQCLAATLTETPSNLKIPTVYADHIRSLMPPSIECIIRDKEWIKGQNMNLFLGVNQGSVEPAVFIEAHYKGSDKKPIVLIGKGVVFDSGGISLKPSIGMGLMKADMMGSAVVFAVIRAVALLKLPIHVIALSPVTENLPSGSAYKPGDVLTAKNGITVEVDNPDCEGRLAMADTMTYAEIFDPAQVMDFATLTYGTRDSLASLASAVFSRSPQMIEEFKKSAALTGDRVWQMPLYKDFKKLLESHVADILNCTLKRDVSACTAAIFLSQFVKIKEWIHFDLAGVMTNDRPPYPYCPGGTTGRPTRTVVEYLKLQSEKK
ncbi:Cytosol aminopeptidase [Thelohanellus kitauei]|uniref:Cytosol aminopeptidase n=1 Tax=Thelohanellus kitauei TaxID=669202 RepID=A0A0C2MF90_THEKT|nr:Cytosol aminopeptidase [Thelohanellus kitauei]